MYGNSEGDILVTPQAPTLSTVWVLSTANAGDISNLDANRFFRNTENIHKKQNKRNPP